MIFDLEKREQGDWFAYFKSSIDPATGQAAYEEAEPDAAEFRIRPMAPFWEERRRSRKREAKMVLNPATRSMERVTYFADLTPEQEAKENEDAWDYAITDWRGVFLPDGSELECNRENKLRMVRLPEFMRFASRVFEILSGTAESLEKNSVSG